MVYSDDSEISFNNTFVLIFKLMIFNLTKILQRLPHIEKFLSLILWIPLSFIRVISKLTKYSGNNIVIISFHKLGDTVFTIPAVEQIVKNFNEKIIIICFPESKIIYFEKFKNVIYSVLEHDDFHLSGRIPSIKAIRKLKNLNPKIIFDLTMSITSASLVLTSGTGYIIGSNKIYFKRIYSHFIPLNEKIHLIDKYIAAVSTYITNINWSMGSYTKNPMTLEKPRLVLNPSAGWPAKEWNLLKFIAVGKLFSQALEVCFIIKEGYLNPDIVEEMKMQGLAVIQTNSVEGLIHEIKKCSFFIGNDSGPLNIASLLIGKPTFCIFGPTNPSFHYMKTDFSKYIFNKLACSPSESEKYCFTRAGIFGCPAYQCMHQLPVDKVYSELVNFLALPGIEDNDKAVSNG
jgi:heptosyltransferase-2